MVGADLEQVSQYLAGIGMGTPLVDRTKVILERLIEFLPEEPRYFFVSEYRDADGNRNYDSLWLLSESYMAESQQFVVTDQFDVTRVDRGLMRVFISHEDFDFDEPADSSRMSVDVNIEGSGPIMGTFKASGSNCSDLNVILRQYFLPLLSKNPAKD